MEQRICIKFCVKNKIKCADAFRTLTVAYGEATLDRSNVYRWYKMFSEGREDVNEFFLFPKLKRPMKGRRYVTIEEIKTTSKEELNKITKNDFLKYISFRFHQVNDRLHVFYSKFFENNAGYRRQNRSNSVCQRITETEDCKQCIWIIM
ncbi:hypothetical protein ALC57_00995 [Trachymyrmex cornetzi]|uniref:Mos1 transposase HTH domain-containing protein n=1 Tax=Trachymyrmex cornetzi TaxID=471704 RepID=A0A151JR73_9HYME|nr:hypothetical protein ALC57_00995 [Trachymyrmex cornetzi]